MELLPLGGGYSISTIPNLSFSFAFEVLEHSILPALAGVVLSTRRLLKGVWHPLTISLLLNAVVLLFLPTSTFREPVAMLRLTQGLVVAMLLYGGLIRSRRILNYSTFWLATNVLLLKGVA